jgi:hypothetical protein
MTLDKAIFDKGSVSFVCEKVWYNSEKSKLKGRNTHDRTESDRMSIRI